MTEQHDPAKVILRKINEDTDLPFIYSSWRNSLWNDQHRPDSVAKEFFGQETKRIKKLLTNPSSYTMVAVLADDHDFILGYSVAIETNLEWVYVKLDYRKKGIGRLLAGHFTTISEPRTKIGRAITKLKHCVIKENHGRSRPSANQDKAGAKAKSTTNQSRHSKA